MYEYNGEDYKYKLAWQEEEGGKWGTAYGDSFTVTGSVVVFHGSIGDIILPPTIKYIIK